VTSCSDDRSVHDERRRDQIGDGHFTTNLDGVGHAETLRIYQAARLRDVQDFVILGELTDIEAAAGFGTIAVREANCGLQEDSLRCPSSRSARRWLAALDDFRNYLINAA